MAVRFVSYKFTKLVCKLNAVSVGDVLTWQVLCLALCGRGTTEIVSGTDFVLVIILLSHACNSLY